MTAPPLPDDTRARITRFLRDTGLAPAEAVIAPLTPDASDRRYFRVSAPDRAPMVLAVHTGAFDFDQSSFVGVHRLLTAMPVPVPPLLGHVNTLGVMAQADLGDLTLYAWLPGASSDARLARYSEAVDLIATLQTRGAELASPLYPPYALAFDVEKLSFELDFCLRHFLEGSRGLRWRPSERDALLGEFDTIVSELAAEPRVLCHRDYHSRNLMLHAGQMHLIDFQDARMGPDTYDLASLLRDSYVSLADAEVEALITRFLARRHPDAVPPGPAREAFRSRFEVMALQRNLKALGTFGFQAVSRNNPVYLQYVPRTLGYIRTCLSTAPRFANLRDLLAAHLPELR